LVAATRNVYAVPFESPVTVVEVAAETLSANDAQEDPSEEYSTL
jgi:hypothetical protein